MPNSKILSDLLKAASKLPKGSPAAKEAVAAKIAAEEAEQAARYAPHTPPTETGRKALAKAKQTLMTPEQQAKMEAELREKGKQKFLEPSVVKQRMYHGTEHDISQFRPSHRGSVFLSPEPEFANRYAGGEYTVDVGGAPNVLPVYAQVRNPFDPQNAEHVQKVYEHINKYQKGAVAKESLQEGDFGTIESYPVQQAIKRLGFDGFFVIEDGVKNLGVYDPRRIKSATGNIGTYDITTPDITKKNGGLAMADGGQAFPLQENFQTEIERRAARPRTRAGVPVEDTNVLGGALQGLGETLVGGGRGALATMLGAPADILNLLNVKQFGTPDIPYGSEFFKESLPLAPTTQTGKTAQQLGEFLPINPEQPVQAGVAGARRAGKALAPTMADMLEAQLQKTGMMMPIAPESKAAKIKAPANEVGFYNPAEKAALNLQRKKGTGDAFISDLKKQPGVTDERLAELGLDQFKGKPNVTREEIIAATEERRIPLQESVKRERDEARIEQLENEYEDLLDGHAEARATGDLRAQDRFEREMADNLDEQKALKFIDEARYGPSSHPDYVMPGGTDYREIRISLPLEKNKEIKVVPHPTKEGYALQYPNGRFVGRADAPDTVGTTDPNFANNWTSVEAAKEYGVPFHSSAFMHTAHHGNEPNVLLHLRVANHADAEGKKGLLIDELQSDWHQQGREKGYRTKENMLPAKPASYEDIVVGDEISGWGKVQGIRDGQSGKEFDVGGLWIPESKFSLDKVADRNVGGISEGRNKQLVPDAPFKDNWYQLGLKRAIKEAADTGMDRVYLTTGARQADRYDLSRHMSSIEYKDGVLKGYNNDGDLVVNRHVSPDELPNYVGKDLGKTMAENAAKDAELRNQLSKATYEGLPSSHIYKELEDVKTYYTGLDLKVGGEGMKQWYDKTYKNYLEKYAKQHGSKLGTTTIADGEPVYYIDITDAMRESAKKGQSYKDGGAVHPAVEKFAASLPHPAVTEFVAKLADGGGVWKAMVDGKYNTVPDTSDAERIIQGPAFAKGGGVWEQLVKGAGNA